MERQETPKLNQITDHVYWLSPDETTDRPVLGVVSGEHSTLIVDAGNSPAHAQLLLGELTRIKVAPPRFLVLTHWHWDHVFGAHTFALPTLASIQTRRIVEEMAQLDWSDEAIDRRVEEGVEIEFCRDNMKAELPDRSQLILKAPEIGYSSLLELDLGGVICDLVTVGGDHASDSSIVYVREDKVMFLGDCLSEDLYSGPPSFTTRKLYPLLDQLLSFDADFYLEGHAPEPMTRGQMVELATLFKRIGREVERSGPEREAILSALRTGMDEALDDETLEIVDSYLAGLRKP